MSDERKIDEVTGVETTGHEWDGIQELNTPLPRWWLQIFYATIVFSIVYMVLYPAWPLISSATTGVLGYSTRQEVYDAIDAHAEGQAQWRSQIEAMSLEEIVADPELFQFARLAGESAYAVNCSQCHGSGATGGPGYPNLNDDDWLWGGSLEEIEWTIRHGVRNEDLDSRFSEMIAYEGVLTDEEVDATVQYVLSLSGVDHDADLAAGGAEIFDLQCSSCHGADGGGDQFLGAPNLSDAIWLIAGDADGVRSQILMPQHGVMPAWGERLDEETIKELTIYVHALGGGE